MALAILLSFALAPAILLLRRWRIARVPAVVVVMMLHCDSPAEGARPDRLRTKRGRTQAAPQPRDESVTATPRLSLGLTGWDLLALGCRGRPVQCWGSSCPILSRG
jgi:hypothetical protein